MDGAIHLYTVDDISRMLQLSSRTVWDLIKTRKLGHVRPSPNAVRVSNLQLKEYIAAMSVCAKPE
jgi:excisionase family DNA binding protein